MLDCLISRRQKGVVFFEFFVFFLPFVLLIIAWINVQHVLREKAALSQGIYIGVRYATQLQHPLSASDKARIRSVVMYGTLDTNRPLLTKAWEESGAQINIESVHFTVPGYKHYPVVYKGVRVTGTIPFTPVCSPGPPYTIFPTELSVSYASPYLP